MKKQNNKMIKKHKLFQNTGCKSVHHEPLLFHLLRPTCANKIAVDRGFDRQMGQTKDF
jgi:hypothetical protein